MANERARLSLDIPQAVRDQLSRLEKLTDSGSITEVVRRALNLYELIATLQKKGGKVIIQHKDGTQETYRIV